jgi:hypothetical protein
MVVERTEALTVSRVEGVGILYLLPADKLADSSLLPAVPMECDVEQVCTL